MTRGVELKKRTVIAVWHPKQLAVAWSIRGGCTYLHAVCKHDTDRHQLGEDLQQLRVGQHAVLQAVIQEACVVAQDIINIGCLSQNSTVMKNQTRTAVLHQTKALTQHPASDSDLSDMLEGMFRYFSCTFQLQETSWGGDCICTTAFNSPSPAFYL